MKNIETSAISHPPYFVSLSLKMQNKHAIMQRQLVLYVEEQIDPGSATQETDWKAFVTFDQAREQFVFAGTRRNAKYTAFSDVLLTFRSKEELFYFLAQALCPKSAVTLAMHIMDTSGLVDKSFSAFRHASDQAEELFAYDKQGFDKTRLVLLLNMLQTTRVDWASL